MDLLHLSIPLDPWDLSFLSNRLHLSIPMAQLCLSGLLCLSFQSFLFHPWDQLYQ
jgi:hypothetical protein